MYRLLVVDDEPHVVNWLVNLFQTQTDIDFEVFKAYSGMAALDLLDRHRIDVILLDIKMPGLSGLEVADRINLNWPSCRIVILTGHSDFDSIYKANKKNNVTYLLKTEDDAEIFAAVQNCIASLEASRKSDDFVNQAIWSERFSQYLVKREILRHVVAGLQFDDVRERIHWQPKDLKFDASRPVFLIHIRIRWLNAAQYDTDFNSLMIKMEHIIQTNLNDRFSVALVDTDPTNVVCFLQLGPESTQATVADFIYVKESLDGIVNQCAAALCCSTVFLLYEREVEWKEVGVTCEQMADRCQILLQTEIFSESYASVFKAEQDPSSIADACARSPVAASLFENLFHYINQGDRDAFHAEFEKLSRQVQNKSNMHHLPTIRSYQSISLLYIDFIIRYSLQEKISTRIRLHNLFSLDSFSCWTDAFHYLEKVADALFALIGNEEQSRNERLVSAIKHYIRSHLDAEMTLTSIANNVNYSSSYISRVFNQTAQISISAYINNARVEKAKELLQQTNENVQEVAQKTGFVTPQYFAIVFKKNVGISPREYRNLFFPESGR
jgi:two-component system response regulator YesN